MQAFHASPPLPDASEPFTGRDISERKRAEAVLRQREAVLEATAFMAERLMQTRSWHACIDDVLARLGQAVGASRVYIFENHAAPDGTALATQRFEWTAPGVVPQIDNPDLQGLPWIEAGFARWYASLRLGKPIAGSTETFPEDEAAFLIAQDIRSLAIVPISLEGTLWGFIGFDDCREPRSWSEGEVEALKAVAHMLGVAIGRARDVTRQQQADPAPRLVLLTSINQEHSLRQRAREAGIAALLYKPLKPEQLHNALTGLFDASSERTTGLHPPALTSEAAPERPAARHPLRILLADDNLFNQKVVLRMLERLCFQADVAANGLEVLDALHRQPYDVILMDVQMPEMDGLEATRRIRADFSDDAQPVIIAMTAGVMAGDREACLAAGMDDYISKPIQLAEIETLLQSLTAAREAVPARLVVDAASVDAYLLALEARMQELADTSDPGFLCELLQEYRVSAKALLAQLEAGVAAGSSTAVSFAAHSLKSSSAMVAADTLWAMCIEIEEHGRNDDLAQAGALFRQIKQHAAYFLRLSEAAIERLRASST